jgi:hypothetical protein
MNHRDHRGGTEVTEAELELSQEAAEKVEKTLREDRRQVSASSAASCPISGSSAL